MGDGVAARQTALNSPWDLALLEREAGPLLLVAMAGSHQIWMIDLDRALAFRYAGSGREARIDGSVDDAAFAQPSGLALDGRALFVAAAESNIIRKIELPPSNEVTTLAGGDLFDFGDTDGRGAAARLYVADTNNHAVRHIDLTTGQVRTVML